MFYLVIAAVFAFICYHMAKKRGRNAALGAVMGALFGLIAVICYAIAGNTDERKAEIMKEVMNR